jgi:amino acid adenylation domain-containing protein
VLRSGIEVDPAGEPVLVVRLASAAELPFTQVAEPSGLAAHLRASFDRPFDLAHGPLLRAELFGLEPRKQVLLLVVHHLAADEWTLGLLGAELSAAYSALAAGHPVELPDLPLQYGDYAHWQHTSLTSGALAGHREYWTRQLAGLEPLTVPPDRPRPPQQSFVGRRVGIWVPPELLAGLRAAARPQGGTDFMALIAGFLALLGRWTGRRDVAVGTVTADRRTADLHRLAGFFVNTVALRLDLSGDPSFEQLVRRVRDATTDAIEHQDLPFDQLMATAGATRDGSGAPLFGIAVSYLNTPPGEIGFRGLTAREVGVETGVVRFDLDVFMRERGGGIAVEVDYRVDLFDEVTICRLLDSYLRLLIAAARTPAAPLEAADLTGPDGWTELTALGRRPAAHPAAPLVPDLIAEQARLRPGATAVRSTERVLRYAELDSESDRLADRLRALGAGRDRIVAVLLERSADFVVALLAVLKAGAGYLPLDPSLPDERLAELVADSGAPLAVSRTALAGRLGGTAATVVLIDASDRDAAGPEPATDPRPPIGAADLAYVIYTSGSTGRPKGVLVEHAGLANLCRWHINAYGLTPADRGTLVAAQAFDASVWELWPYLVAGAGVSIADEATRSDPDRIVRWLADQRATVAFLATPLAEAVLDGDQVRGLPLRFLLTGGDRLRRRPAPGLPFPVINHYGPTECTVVATAGTVADTEHGDGPPAIGRPIDNVEAYLLDDRRQPVRRGAVGELYLGGVQVARGYLNRPEPTARHFLDSPFGRLYRTGDLARWQNDGELEFLGRADRQIKIRGHRIEPGEIEVRLRAHPGVADTVVVAQPVDPRRPDGDRRLVAYLTAPPGPSPAPAELRRWLRERLPEHLVPTRFVLLDQWPMTPSGKIDQARLPPPADIAEDAAYVAPRDDVEREIAQLVADLLGRDRVGIRDGFFELGGDSLQAARLTARLYRAFGVELPVGAVFTGPTVEEMATALVTAALAEESGQGAGNGVVRQ